MFTYLSKQDGEIIMAFWSILNGHFRLQYACQEGDPDGSLDDWRVSWMSSGHSENPLRLLRGLI